MKLLYIFLSVSSLFFGSYLFINNFNFDNITFSNYLINALFVLLLCSLSIGGLVALFTYRRKHHHKEMMTIRQYYQYRSAR